MNYIKKKIKGSSKKAAAAAAEDDDDFDPNLFHVLQRPAEGAPEGWVPYDDRVDEESDEWRQFRQLTQRVTETLTETKENLSKIVATTALTETSREWQIRKITATSEEQQPQLPVNGVSVPVTSAAVSSRPERPAPPRPPPPSSSSSTTVHFDDHRFEAAFPSSNFDGGEFHARSAPARPSKLPAVPPPPAPDELEFDLGAEFGFEPVKPASNYAAAAAASTRRTAAATGSLFLDDEDVVLNAPDEGPDPFDTSFVTTATSTAAVSHVQQQQQQQADHVLHPIKGVIPDEHLDAICAVVPEEDDPFVIKDIVIAEKFEVESDESEDEDDDGERMDPFESFLQGASSGQVSSRAKSPNPFLVDSGDDMMTSSSAAAAISSSNPFAVGGGGDGDDDPFATQLAPNPFASMSLSSATSGAAVDLFGFGDDDTFDHDSAGTCIATSNDASNPFASFAQPEVTLASATTVVSDDATFDPFGCVGATNESYSANGSDILKSSQKLSGSAFNDDPFGLGNTRGNIPAAPSSQDLFGLDDDQNFLEQNRKLFQQTEQEQAKSFHHQQDDATQQFDHSAEPKEFKASFTAFDVDVDADVDGSAANQDSSPHIDFFNADSAVVNVSGVSVELSEVSPAKQDDFDEFFVGSNDDEDGVKEEAAPPATKTAAPPPRPPPPTVVNKPARPPPPKVVQDDDDDAATTTFSAAAATAAVKPEAIEKTFDAFFTDSDENFVGQVPHKKREFDKSWDAFPPIVADDLKASGALQQQQPDPFGLSSTAALCDDHVDNERRKSGTFDTYERKASGPIDELLGCFETSVAPIVPAIAQAAVDELDFFGVGVGGGQPEEVSDVKPFAVAVESGGIGGGGGGDLFACEPLTPPDDEPAEVGNVKAAITTKVEDTKGLKDVDDVQVPFTDMAAFDAFEAKFQSTSETTTTVSSTFDVFGSASDGDGHVSVITTENICQGFGAADDFDQFFALKETPAAPKPSPARFPTTMPEKPPSEPVSMKAAAGDDSSSDSDDTGPDFSVFIRPKMKDKDDASTLHLGPIPALAPPPKSPMRSPPSHTSPRFNPFDKEPGATAEDAARSGFVDVDAFSAAFSTPVPPETPPHDLPGFTGSTPPPKIGASQSVESQESPGSPLFELDDSEPLEDFFPKRDAAQGWDLMLRQPSKKKLTGQRFWKKVYVTISDNGVLHLYNKSDDKDAFQELPLQACYSLTEIGAQQYDTYGKIFTVKLQYVFYRERVGVRPGQISKVTHGQVTSLGQLAKLGLPLEHSPQVSQLLKLGTQQYEELRVFIREVEDSLFHLSVHRDRALTYKTEEVQVTVVDELRAEVQASGVVLSQLARVRAFFLAFIVGMPDVELGLNDITKQGREVVGRHDIIPVVTEEWIRLEKCEFHSCVTVSDFEKTRTIKFHPPDACFFEILRFRIRPPKNRELPLQVKATMSIIGNRVEIRADVLVPGCISRKHGQIPCEDVSIRFPLPECWIYLFRVEKHFRYGSLKSAARKPGKIKGLERIMGAGLTMEPSMIEVSTGQAKYEHQHRAIVWRVPRLPKDGQGAYTTQLFVCRMELTSYDQIPAELDHYVHVEFTMPATTVSHTTVRSVSVTNPNPPEKYVKYLARHKYRVEIEHVTATSECDYVAATTTNAAAATKGQPNSSQGQDSSANQ